MAKPLLIGHRGARGLAPENTLLALDAGIAAGCPWLEFDVQLHPSGPLFLLHDLTLERTTNGHGLASDCEWSRLRQLDAGQGQRLPTLDELNALAGAAQDVARGIDANRESIGYRDFIGLPSVARRSFNAETD